MPKPWGPPGDGGPKVAEAKCTDEVYSLIQRSKGLDVKGFTDALERIEQKLETLGVLNELPQQLEGISGILGDLQRGLQSLGGHKAPLLMRRGTDSRTEAYDRRGSTCSVVSLVPYVPARGRARSSEHSASAWRLQTAADVAGARARSADTLGRSEHADRSTPPPPSAASTSPAHSTHRLSLKEDRAPGTGSLLCSEESEVDPEKGFSPNHITFKEGNSDDPDDPGSSWMPHRFDDPKKKPGEALRGHFAAFTRRSYSSCSELMQGSGRGSFMMSLTRRGSTSASEGAMAARAAMHMAEVLGENAHTSCFVVRPDWKPKLIWDMVAIAFLVLNAMVVLYGLVYNSDADCLCVNTPMATAMHTADAIWLLNIPISFCTGFTERNGQLVMYPRFVAKRYARRWLAFDAATLWPSFLLPPPGVACWLFGLVKLVRLLRLPSLFARIQRSEFRFQAFILKSVTAVAMPAHTMACLWRLASRADGSSVPITGGPSAWFPVYVEDSYWVLMTMTTVGYGDISPVGTIGRLFSIFAMLIASVFFGTIVSVTSQAIGPLFDDPDERRVARALNFMRRRGVELELMSRVEHSLRRRLHQSSQISMDSDLFRLLTPTVQRELALALLQEVVLQFPLFKGVNRSFVGELAQAQVWMQSTPGDIVAEDGQLVREVVFVVQGRLTAFFGPRSDGRHIDIHLTVTDGERASMAAMFHNSPAMSMQHMSDPDSRTPNSRVIDAGAWFGEACLFDDTRIRTATIVAREENDLAVLSREDFFAIIARYPRLSERHSKLQNAINRGRVSIDELAYPS